MTYHHDTANKCLILILDSVLSDISVLEYNGTIGFYLY